MIDDKAIMAAANEYTRFVFHYKTMERIAFVEGAKWGIEQFLKDLWHPIKEKPQRERVFLYQDADNAFGIKSIVEASDWKFIIKYQRAIRWLYIDGLLPKEGGEKWKYLRY